MRMDKGFWRTLSMAGFVAAAMVMGSMSSFAGGCPAGKMVSDGQGEKDAGMAAKDVTDTVLASTDLSTEAVALPDHLFRLRQLVIKPGGVVPWHSHADRPAMIYIVSGQVTEYASTCAVPILHKAGDVAPETHTTAHWWKNTGSKTAVLISVDILHDQKDQHMM